MILKGTVAPLDISKGLNIQNRSTSVCSVFLITHIHREASVLSPPLLFNFIDISVMPVCPVVKHNGCYII